MDWIAKPFILPLQIFATITLKITFSQNSRNNRRYWATLAAPVVANSEKNMCIFYVVVVAVVVVLVVAVDIVEDDAEDDAEDDDDDDVDDVDVDVDDVDDDDQEGGEGEGHATLKI